MLTLQAVIRYSWCEQVHGTQIVRLVTVLESSAVTHLDLSAHDWSSNFEN